MRFERQSKFNLLLIGPLKIIRNVGEIACVLALPPCLSVVH